MRNISTSFLATGAAFALIGMIWGIQMSASHDHTLAPAHGHLNLVGFVAMSVFGFYYALTPQAAESRIARLHYLLATTTVLLLAPGIALAISGRGEALAQAGSVLAVVTMGVYLFVVLRFGIGSKQAGPAIGSSAIASPAE